MADIVFKAKFDTTDVNSGFKDIADATKATTKVVGDEAKKQRKIINDERKKNKPIPQPVDPKAINIVRQLKKEMNGYIAAAAKAGEGTKEWADNLAKAGELKGEINDLQSAIKSLDPDVKAAAFSNLAASGVESLNGIAGAFALVGVESENYQKILVRLQGLQAIATSIRSISGLSDQWNEAKLVLASYVAKLEEKIIADKLSQATVFIGTAEQLAASDAKIAAIQAEIVATNQATLATRLLNAVKAVTPWGAIAVAIGAVVTIIASYVASSQAAKEADKIRNTTTDGLIIKNKELREEYEKILLAQKKWNIDLEITAGRMSKVAGEIDKLKADKISALDEATKEYNATLASQNTWYERLAVSFAAAAAMTDRQTIREVRNAEQVRKLQEQRLVEEKKLQQGIQEIEDKAAQERKEHAAENEIEILNTKKAILEAGGQSTYEIQRAIVIQEQALADERANVEADAEGVRALNAQKAAQAMIAIDKAEADARRAFRQQLNALVISQMADGQEKELTLLQENYRAQNEDRIDFFNRETGLLKEKYDKDLAQLNESLRTQREAILNDAALSGGQKAELTKQLDASINKQRLDLEIKFQEDKLLIEKEYDRKRFEDSQKNLDAIAKQKQDNIQFEVDMIDAQGEIENAHLKEQLNKKLISHAEYDKQLAKNELEAIKRRRDAVLKQDQLEYDRLQEKLRAQQAIGEDETETVAKLDAIKKKMALDKLKFEGEIANQSVEIEADAIEERKQLLESAKQSFEVIKNAADEIIARQQESLDRAKELNDAAIAENDRYLGVLTQQLKDEMDARAGGFASNVELIEGQIEAEKEARRQNLEDQKEIQAQQSRLNKIKLIEDKAQQASALITAAANILKGWSSLPLVGQILGVAAIGAMLASFLSFSNKAKAAPGFAKGTKKAPPGLKWVGEEGPELINDKGGYQIFTNKESQKIMRGFNEKIPQYDFTSNISNVLRPSNATDTKGIERRLDKSNDLLEKGMNEPKIIYDGDRKIVRSGSTTNITRRLNGRN